MKKKLLSSLLFVGLIGILGCNQSDNTEAEKKPLAKFEPADGKCILFVGQEMEAIGGLEDYNDGYIDHFPTPGGFTMYTKIRPGDEQYGFKLKGLDGVFTTDEWGDSPSNMTLQVNSPAYENMALAIGLEFVNHEEKLATGVHDSLVVALGEWIKNLGKRPVFLRIGYEFGGEWNHYDREYFIASYKRMKDMYDEMGIENIAYVWQDHGWGMSLEDLESWWPGDEYVDWCGTSFFSRWDEILMIDFARSKGKPLFIAEATPVISTETVKTDGKTKETILSNPEQATEAWKHWFIPLFKTIDENPDVVKAVSYINCNWKSHAHWFDNPTFQDVDARLHLSPEISKKWLEETSKGKYLKSSAGLYRELWGD